MNPEQEALVLKASRTIRSAKLLLTDGDYDSAVSCAYYAMFYLVEALLLSKDLAFSKHSAVIAGFGQEFVRTGTMPPDLHTYLKDAFKFSHAEEFLVVADAFLTAEHTNEAGQ